MSDNPFKVHEHLIFETQQHAKTIFEDALEYIVGHSYDATREQEYSAGLIAGCLKYEIEVRESCEHITTTRYFDEKSSDYTEMGCRKTGLRRGCTCAFRFRTFKVLDLLEKFAFSTL